MMDGDIVVQGNFTREQIVKNYTKQFVNWFDGEIPTNWDVVEVTPLTDFNKLPLYFEGELE